MHGPDDVAAVTVELNERPRKILGWVSPADRLETLLPGSTGPERTW